MGDVLKYPTRTNLVCKGAISYKVMIEPVIDGCVVAGQVRFSDTDCNEVAVFINDPSVIAQKKWLDYTHRGEIAFTMLSIGALVRAVELYHLPERRRVFFLLHTIDDLDGGVDLRDENRVLEWIGSAQQPHQAFTA